MAGPAAPVAVAAMTGYRLWKLRKKLKKAKKLKKPAKKGWKWVKEKGQWVWRGKTLEELREKVRTKKRPSQSHKFRKTKSKRGPGSARKRTGRPKSRKTMRARSAPKPKMVHYRKGGCPPGYRYDPRRKMCIQYNYK